MAWRGRGEYVTNDTRRSDGRGPADAPAGFRLTLDRDAAGARVAGHPARPAARHQARAHARRALGVAAGLSDRRLKVRLSEGGGKREAARRRGFAVQDDRRFSPKNVATGLALKFAI